MKVLNILINEYATKSEALSAKKSPEAKGKQLYIRKHTYKGACCWILYERLVD